MNDDPKPAVEVAAPEDAPAPAQAPAVHSDVMWDGPQWVEDATAEPVWVETKAEFLALLNSRNLHMQDQQESHTGPEQVKIPDPTPAHLLPPPPVPSMFKEEAEIYGAVTAIFKRYGLHEAIWCEHCFARHVPHGCRMRVTSRLVHLECRCGIARYVPPTGTTDLVLSTLANSAVTLNDRTGGSVLTQMGAEFRPTFLLNDVEATLLRRYIKALSLRGKEPWLFHVGCWNSDPRKEEDASAMDINARQVVIVCKCRTLFWAAKGTVK